MQFYRVMLNCDETRESEEWVLSTSWERDGRAIDVWSYVMCRPGQRDPAPFLQIRRSGKRTCFDLAGGESVPVAATHIAECLENLAGADFERIPATVEDGTPMEIINVLSCVDCIDYEKSILKCFAPRSKVRPDRAGELHVDYRLVIDPTRVGDHQIFRLCELKLTLIVTDAIRSALEANADLSGIEFQPIATECDEPGKLFYWDDDLRRNVEWTHEERLAFLQQRQHSSG